MEIRRDTYLRQLIDRQWNGLVKVVTGIRRCGKSYLLGKLFRDYLLSQGVVPEQILHLELDLTANMRYRNPLALSEYVCERMRGETVRHYLFID